MERRKHVRTNISMEVVVILPDGEQLFLRTADTSDGGALLLSDGKSMPEVGTEIGITVRNAIAGKKAPIHKARVVRETADGIGIQLIIPGSMKPPPD